MKLKGRVAIVTGAGSGIGRVTALKLAAEGAAVLCADIANADRTVEEILREDGEASTAAFTLDVRDAQAWSEAVREVESRFGDVDCLANVAGIVTAGVDTAIEQTVEEWSRIIATNLTGTWLGVRAVLPRMIERGCGSIVNIAAHSAIIGVPGLLAYSASKGGVAALTRQVAIEYVKRGVTVNAIAPGFIKTPIQNSVEQHLLDDMAAGIPMGRVGTPEDIAGMIVHLCSVEGRYITGQVIAIDGGWGVS